MSTYSTTLRSLAKRLDTTTSLPDRLSILQSLGRTLSEHHVPPTEEHFNWLQEMITLAEDLNRSVSIGEGFELEGDCHARGNNWKQALKSWGKALRIFKDVDATEERIRLNLKSARASRELKRFAETTEFYKEAIDLSKKEENREEQKSALKELGEFYTTIGDHARALPLFLDLLRIAEKSAPTEERGRALSDIGIAYAELGETKRALEHLQSALTQFHDSRSHALEVMTLVNLTNIYTAIGQVESALHCGLRALAIYDALHDQKGIATTLLNLSNISEGSGDLQSAADYRVKALDIFEDLNDQRGQAIALVGLGSLYARAGKLNDARYVLEQTLLLAEEIEETNILCRCHELLAETLEQIGDSTKGIHHLRRYIELQREIDMREQRKIAAETQTRFDLERSENEREILQLKAERLEAEIRTDKAELNALSLQLIEKQKFIETLVEKLEKIKTEARDDVKPLAEEMIQEIKRSFSNNMNWQSFQQQFERTNPELLHRIARRWPLLTQKDLQFCALAVTGLSTGEIAELLHVTTRTVETTRYRIRGKIEIDSKVELGTFLQGL